MATEKQKDATAALIEELLESINGHSLAQIFCATQLVLSEALDHSEGEGRNLDKARETMDQLKSGVLNHLSEKGWK